MATGVPLRGVVVLATMLTLGVGSAHAVPPRVVDAARHCARPALVGDKTACLRVGQRCSRAYRRAYLRAGFVCREVGRKPHRRSRLSDASYAQRRHGEVLDLGPSGRPTFRQALWWFDTDVAPLPGIRTPKGAVGRDRFGGAVRALDYYRSRLSRAQRRVLSQAMKPGRLVAKIDPEGNLVPGASAARARGGPADQPKVLAEAVRRLRAHGVIFRHAIAYHEAGKTPTDGRDADTTGSWLYGNGRDCDVTFYPLALTRSLAIRRVEFVHELMHCAMFEAASSRNVADAQPAFLDEGLPTLVMYRVGIEWQNSIGGASVDYWPAYFQRPWSSLYGRSYDAVGWWALAEHEGLDLFALQRKLVPIGGTGNAAAVAKAVRQEAPGLDGDWGPTLATNSALGRRWEIAGPAETPRKEPNKGALNEDGTITEAAEDAAGEDFRFDQQAEVVVVNSLPTADGLILDADHRELPLRGGETRYCAIDEGCECPDGRKLEYQPIAMGEAHLGFAAPETYSKIALQGMSLDEACGAPKRTRQIDPKTGIVNGVKLGMLRGSPGKRRTVISLLGRPKTVVKEGGLEFDTFTDEDNSELGVYFRPNQAGGKAARDKVVGVLTFSPRYGGQLSVGKLFPAALDDCAPVDRRVGPDGGPPRVSACINRPGPAGVRDIVYMAATAHTRAGQRINGVGVFEAGVGNALFNSLVQGALEDLGCSNVACT